MGYMVCEECGKYFELKPDESHEDFGKCECGGTLKYVENLDLPPENVSHSPNRETNNLDKTPKPLNWVKLGVTSVLTAILIVILAENYFIAAYLVWFIPLVMGGIWAYLNRLNVISGVKEGFILGFTAMLMVVVFALITAGITRGITGDDVLEIEFLILSIIVFGIIGSIGGAIPGSINTKKIAQKRGNS